MNIEERKSLLEYYDCNSNKRAFDQSILYQLLLTDLTVKEIYAQRMKEAEVHNAKFMPLPPEVLFDVFANVNVSDYKNVLTSCSLFGNVIMDDIFRKKALLLMQRDYSQTPTSVFMPLKANDLIILNSNMLALAMEEWKWIYVYR